MATAQNLQELAGTQRAQKPRGQCTADPGALSCSWRSRKQQHRAATVWWLRRLQQHGIWCWRTQSSYVAGALVGWGSSSSNMSSSMPVLMISCPESGAACLDEACGVEGGTLLIEVRQHLCTVCVCVLLVVVVMCAQRLEAPGLNQVLSSDLGCTCKTA